MRELTNDQIGAIRRCIELGRTLQVNNPEMLILYREGYSLTMIAETLNIGSIYGVGNNVAYGAVHKALVGHNGEFRRETYAGLIPDKAERERIRHEHQSTTWKKIGDRLYREGRGIHGQTPEQRREISSRAGKIGGSKIYKDKIGVHARTKDQMREDGRKGGLISGPQAGRLLYEQKKGIHGLTREQREEAIRAAGMVPWSDEEKRTLYRLAEQPSFKYGLRRSNRRLAQALNELHHGGEGVRTINSVKRFIYRNASKDS